MKRATIVLAAWALSACSVEPLQPQSLPAPAQYTRDPVDLPQLAAGTEIPAAWWQLFQSDALDSLVRRALDANPTLARAQARLVQAQEEFGARAGATQYPRVDAKLSSNRVDVQPQSLGGPGLPVPMPLSLYLASVGVSYTFDFFGANRHELEALRAEVEHERFELEAARLMLAGNVVTAAVREAALREQIEHTEEIIALQQRQLAIVERLEQIGTRSPSDLAAQRRDLAQTRAGLPELRRQLEQTRHRLAIYVGAAPGAAQLPEFRQADLRLPDQLPLTLPSELARRRPDIRASEALLRQAGERVGVATANLYPQVTLSATTGSLTSHPGDLFAGGTGFYLLGASLAQPLFHGGELQARRRAAVATYEQAGAAYQETVLRSFQEVADVLRALEADEKKLGERAEAAQQARRVADIAAARLAAGGVSDYAVLDAQRKLHAALLDRTQATADRHADSAALLQALGGGWWARSK